MSFYQKEVHDKSDKLMWKVDDGLYFWDNEQ